jgi:hypothetical protein
MAELRIINGKSNEVTPHRARKLRRCMAERLEAYVGARRWALAACRMARSMRAGTWRGRVELAAEDALAAALEARFWFKQAKSAVEAMGPVVTGAAWSANGLRNVQNANRCR